MNQMLNLITLEGKILKTLKSIPRYLENYLKLQE